MGEYTFKWEPTLHTHSSIFSRGSTPSFTPVRYDPYDCCDADRMIRALRAASWPVAGGSLEPSAAISHTQSTRTTGSGGPSGYDACKRAKDRKRHFAVEGEMSSIGVNAHPAGTQNRDDTLKTIVMPQLVPTAETLSADIGFSGQVVSGSFERECRRNPRCARIPDHVIAAAWFRPEPYRHGVSRNQGAPAPMQTRFWPNADSRK